VCAEISGLKHIPAWRLACQLPTTQHGGITRSTCFYKNYACTKIVSISVRPVAGRDVEVWRHHGHGATIQVCVCVCYLCRLMWRSCWCIYCFRADAVGLLWGSLRVLHTLAWGEAWLLLFQVNAGLLNVAPAAVLLMSVGGSVSVGRSIHK
jgi:hypothetical protein